MDTLTHALVGSAVSDSWFRKRLGRVATPFALVVASLPDIDSFTYLVSPQYAWMHHRGYSHSFFVFLLAAPILGYIGYRLAGKTATWLLWTLLAFLCLVTHTLGDLITSWGTMPLLPFSNARISWDLAPIIDVFLTGVTATSFVANRILRHEKVDTFTNPLTFPVVHEHPRRRRMGDWFARVALCLVAVYLLLAVHQNWQTVRLARQQLAANGVDAVEMRALPYMFSYIAWTVVARDADGTLYNATHSTYAPQPMEFIRFPSAHGQDVADALATPEGAMFAWYAQNMHFATVNPEDGVAVRLQDRRFFGLVNPAQSRFIMDFARDDAGRMRQVESRQIAFEGLDVGKELRLLWILMRTGRAVEQE